MRIKGRREGEKMEYIAFDSHKRYTLAVVESKEGRVKRESRIEHEKGALREYLGSCEAGGAVAVETSGGWYYIVDEIEKAGMVARLVHARKAKLMMGMVNKTDKLDARGLNQLQRNGVLPVVWIPPRGLRDLRELTRTRMAMVEARTSLKNRYHATLAKYGLRVEEASDIFSRGARDDLRKATEELPEHTRYSAERVLEEIDRLGEEVKRFEERLAEEFKGNREVELLRTLPGVGPILSVVIWLEVGEVGRFPRAENLASYSGTTPRVSSSGGKTRYGHVRNDVNRYLKWAFAEAANAVSRNRRNWAGRHVVGLYERVRGRKGHQKAIGAVSRHLAEATYWVLTKKEAYREPGNVANGPETGA